MLFMKGSSLNDRYMQREREGGGKPYWGQEAQVKRGVHLLRIE